MQQFDYNNIDVEYRNSEICIISLARKPVNALSTELLTDLNNIFLLLEKNKDLRIIILQSSLEHFSAGADLKQRSIMNENDSQLALDAFKDCFNTIESSTKITICSIKGYCLGGGAEMSLCFDLRFASESAIVGFPEVSIGIIPGAGGTQRLPRIIGLSNAKYWIYSAEKFSGKECLKYNFVNFLTENDKLEHFTLKIANQIIQNSPIGVKCSKLAIDKGYGKSIEEGLLIERDEYNKSVTSEDRNEALKAFIEKRKPKWRNK